MSRTDLLTEAIVDALTQMYEQAEPGLEFSDLQENPDEYPDKWYLYHYLSHTDQTEIVASVADKYNLSKSERHALKMNAITYYGPTANKQRVEEHISNDQPTTEPQKEPSTVQAEDP